MEGTRSRSLQISKHLQLLNFQQTSRNVNVIADLESRNPDLELNRNIFAQLIRVRRLPQVDLFASKRNNQLPVYMSWGPYPGSSAVDALRQPWGNIFWYATPFCLVGIFLSKARQEGTRVINGTPAWKCNLGMLLSCRCCLKILYYCLVHRKCFKSPVGDVTLCR